MSVRSAIQTRKTVSEEHNILPRNFPGQERLTARERDVLERIASAATNKEAGMALGISPRTVETHRAHIMSKLAAKNAADLMRIVLRKRVGQRAPPLSIR
jgi:two-component system response regulator FixJ